MSNLNRNIDVDDDDDDDDISSQEDAALQYSRAGIAASKLLQVDDYSPLGGGGGGGGGGVSRGSSPKECDQLLPGTGSLVQGRFLIQVISFSAQNPFFSALHARRTETAE